MPNRPTPLVKVIALATLVVGTIDISDALIFYGLRGVRPVIILQSIASGILGREAYKGGIHTALLGLALHYFIAFVVVTLYLLASRSLPLSRHPWLNGTLYGIVVYFFMNNVVLPLSHVIPRPHYSLFPFLNGLGASIFLIGIPAALIASRFLSPISEK